MPDHSTIHRRTFLELLLAGIADYGVHPSIAGAALLSSIEATWLSAERKKRMAAEFQGDPSWNEAG